MRWYSRELMPAPCAIEFSGVTKRFGARVAVRDLNLRIPSGSLYGFIGPNGSSKTTTQRMILRIYHPDEGLVRVLGQLQGKAADDRIGYLPEERGLYRRMKVRDILRFHARLKGVKRPEAAIDRWLSRLDLTDRADVRVETLSKGLAQKVQFAAAVVHGPELLILDEPFSGLDPVNVEVLRETILELRHQGTTVLFSTHDMATAERLCDAVMMLHRGEKVLDGGVDGIRAEKSRETIRVRFLDATPELEGIEGVMRVRDYGREQVLDLGSSLDAQTVIREVMARGAVQRVEVAQPTLHEIFVDIARPSAAEAEQIIGDPIMENSSIANGEAGHV